jgi:hypothetical protein
MPLLALSMWILIILTVIFVIIIAWLLWARMVLCINSYDNQYYCSLGGLIVAELIQRKGDLLIRVKTPFYAFYIDPWKADNKVVKPSKKRKPNNKDIKLNITFYLKSLVAFIRTFSFTHFYVDMDTGDYTLNAKLTPILLGLSQGRVHLQTNYRGHIDFWIEIENRLVRFMPLVFRYLRVKYL